MFAQFRRDAFPGLLDFQGELGKGPLQTDDSGPTRASGRVWRGSGPAPERVRKKARPMEMPAETGMPLRVAMSGWSLAYRRRRAAVGTRGALGLAL